MIHMSGLNYTTEKMGYVHGHRVFTTLMDRRYHLFTNQTYSLSWRH